MWRRWGKPSPEATRKLAHVGAGLGCIALPFVIQSPWVVLALALSMSLAFALTQRWRVLPSLHGVGRKSRGSEYYPIAVFGVYLLCRDDPAIYVAAVLVLALGDALAALVGTRYGALRYEVEDDTKSVEGSVTFLVISFLAVHLPLLLMTDLPRAHCVLSALLVATLVTIFEAVSLRGSDNLFVPFAVAVTLQKLVTKPLAEVIFQNLSLVLIAVSVLALSSRFGWFNTGATLVVILYAYGTWALGNWLWALPVLLVLLGGLVVRFRPGRTRTGSVRVRYVAAMALPPFLFVVAGNWQASFHGPFFGPYLACLSAVAVFWVTAHSRFFRDGLPFARRSLLTAAVTAVTALLVIVGPAIAVRDSAGAAMTVMTAAMLATLAETTYTRLMRLEPQPPRWTARRFSFAVIAGLLVLLAQAAGWSPVWQVREAPNPQRYFWPGPQD